MTEFIPANAVGDSFLNRCVINTDFFAALHSLYTPIFGWSEPYPLILLILLLLIVLPTIFRVGAFLKVSRLYNITRLGLLSLFHQISYSYTVVQNLALIIQQPSPCFIDTMELTYINNFSFPSAVVASAPLFIFTVTKFAGIGIGWSLLIWAVFFTLQTLFVMAEMFNSFAQVTVTIFLCYLLHKWHQFLPFRFIHYENAFLFLFSVGVFSYYLIIKYPFTSVFFTMWFTFLVLIIDEVLIWRHHQTRGDFSAIERPGDLKWTIEKEHVETIRLLNSEEEEMFTRNIEVDLQTSVIASIIFFIGVLFRRVVAPVNFFRANS